MKNRSSQNRSVRRDASKIARSTMIGLALFGAVCVEFSGARGDSALPAQDIINNTLTPGNNNAITFSDSSLSNAVQGSFDENSIVDVKLPEPKNIPVVVEAADYRFPFVFPGNAVTSGIASIDLLCSPDKGKTWYSYASVPINDRRREFHFEAVNPGDYWFVLMTSFKSGKRSFSSTRVMTFSEGKGVLDDDESFNLADDLDELPTLSSPSTGAPGNLDELSDLDAPPILNQSDDELLVSNASYAREDAAPELAMPPEPPESDPIATDSASTSDDAVTPWPGKFKNLSFGVGKASGELLVTVRWFRPVDIDARYDVGVRALSIERAPSPNGPWTIVAEDLDVTREGYSWTATPEEMKPFYVRSVARDAQGNVWRDVTTSPMDVNNPAVRSALGPVKTPAPFMDDDAKKKNVAAEDDEPESATSKTKLIRHTASEVDETPAVRRDTPLDPGVDSSRAREQRSGATNADERAARPVARRERPNIPPPTNPGEFQLNPLFTRGFSVLYQSSQARSEPSGPEKRSIFTPPSRSLHNGSVRPAEHYLTQQKIQSARLQQERKAYQERLQYQREHEMETMMQRPELMEGRTFYMDSNGELTTTPPAEMQQALNGSMEAQGWTRVDGMGQTASFTSVPGDGGEPIYMPRDAEAYDASARSGAAMWSNNQYPSASSPGFSPINNRYSDDARATNSPTSGGSAQPAGANPQTSYQIPSRSYAPSYFSNASAASSNYAFPPQPTVSR